MKYRLISWALATAVMAAPAGAQPSGPLTVMRRTTTPVSALPPIGPQSRDWMVAHFINVGQGAATLLEFSCGLVLIDTGGQQTDGVDWPRRLTDYLDKVFTRRPDRDRTIDVVMLTHPHIDHTLGVGRILEPASRIQLRNVVTNAQPGGSGIEGQSDLLDAVVEERRFRVTSLEMPAASALTNDIIDPLGCNGTAPDIRILWGSVEGTQAWRSNGNNHSVVIRVDFEESSFLITGDLAQGAIPSFIRRYQADPSILDVDVYVPGHHGARDGTTARLVQAIKPELAVITVGNPSHVDIEHSAWEYGHPNKRTIDLLTGTPNGVSFARPLRRVAIGISGRPFGTDIAPVFDHMDMRRAIFATGWDGDVLVFASVTGEKRVLID